MEIDSIMLDPAVIDGNLGIRGLRVPVGTALGLIPGGVSRERILSAYSYREPEDLEATRAHAAWRLEEREEDLTAA